MTDNNVKMEFSVVKVEGEKTVNIQTYPNIGQALKAVELVVTLGTDINTIFIKPKYRAVKAKA